MSLRPSALLLACCTLFLSLGASAEVKVLTSIKPLQLIAAAVQDGEGSPDVLLPPGASPHSYALRPSDVRRLREAQLFYWVGPDMEVFLDKPLQARQAPSVAVQELPGMHLRKFVNFENMSHADYEDHDHDHRPGTLDAHLWLLPANAQAIAARMAEDLAIADPLNAGRYQANLKAFDERMEQLDARLKQRLAPLVGNTLPPMPATLGGMTGAILHEVIIGLMLGTLMRALLFTLTTSGEIISLHSGISFAQTANPAEAQPSSSIGTFLAMLGLVLIWSTDLHHLFIRAMVDSFTVFPATRPVMYADGATLMTRTLGETFSLAMQMAAPIIVFSLIFNIATGFVARIMPNFPVFFAATPLNVLLGLSIFALSLGTVGLVWLTQYSDLVAFFARGA